MSTSLVKIKPNRDSKIAHEQLSPQLTLLWTLKAVKGLPWKGTCLQLLAHGTAHLDKKLEDIMKRYMYIKQNNQEIPKLVEV